MVPAPYARVARTSLRGDAEQGTDVPLRTATGPGYGPSVTAPDPTRSERASPDRPSPVDGARYDRRSPWVSLDTARQAAPWEVVMGASLDQEIGA